MVVRQRSTNKRDFDMFTRWATIALCAHNTFPTGTRISRCYRAYRAHIAECRQRSGDGVRLSPARAGVSLRIHRFTHLNRAKISSSALGLAFNDTRDATSESPSSEVYVI